ncbi:MAG: hypothetical protein GXZ14_00910 [Ruminococcaceae bacterium]|nr:hypothetical protein [Oscillospiraceae bacterium]
MSKRISQKPAIAYTQGKRDGEQQGIEYGFIAVSAAALCACDNIWSGDREAMGDFFAAWEHDLNRIFREDCKGDIELCLEVLQYNTEKLREELHIDEKIAKIERERDKQ